MVSVVDCQGSKVKSPLGQKFVWRFPFPPYKLSYDEYTGRTLSGRMRRRGRGLATYPRMLRLRTWSRQHFVPMAALGLMGLLFLTITNCLNLIRKKTCKSWIVGHSRISEFLWVAVSGLELCVAIEQRMTLELEWHSSLISEIVESWEECRRRYCSMSKK